MTPPAETVERVARALETEENRQRRSTDPDAEWPDWGKLARAAIAAQLEALSTPANVAAGEGVVEALELAVREGVREYLAQVIDRHANIKLCRQLAPKAAGTFFAAARHLADDVRAASDFHLDEFLAKRPAYVAALAVLSPTAPPAAEAEVPYDERVEYEERILAAEMETVRTKRARDVLAAYVGKQIECCSTHCERRQECASPNECCGNEAGKAIAAAIRSGAEAEGDAIKYPRRERSGGHYGGQVVASREDNL